MLLLFIVSSLFPNLRVWGFSVWAHFPIYVPILLAVTGIIVGTFEYYWSRKVAGHTVESERESSSRYIIFSLVIVGLFGALLYFLRGRTHFLGDGYSLLTELAKAQPLVKPREMGAGLVLIWMKGLVGGDPQSASEMSYQVVSIGVGICFAVIAAIGSRLLFPRLRERLIFLVGLLTGGCSLMFFGYAENYSLFAISILLFTLLGLLIAQKRANKWLILAPLALACFFHILGTLLIPAAIYLIMGHTRIAAKLARTSKHQRLALVGIPVIIGLIVFGYLYQTDYYFRFAFVPIIPDRFSIKGYSLFSIAHITDIINLLFLLAPGLLLIFALFRIQPLKKLFEPRSARFLLLLVMTTVFATCVLDPKLGMPRDWDLFSFPGIPIAALVLWLMLTRTTRARTHITMAILFVALGILSLLPRAAAQALPEVGIATFTDYLELDPSRARTGMHNLATYHLSHGDTTAAAKSEERRRSLFPYEYYIGLAQQAASRNQVGLAKTYALQALSLNATFADSWLALTYCYVEEGKYDSALETARVADGLNPYNYHIRHEMALAYSHLGDPDAAVKIWRELVARDTTKHGAAFSLARFHQQRGDKEQYAHYLTIAAQRADAPPDLSIELAKYLLEADDLPSAAAACRQFLEKGGDTAQVMALVKANPKLAP